MQSLPENGLVSVIIPTKDRPQLGTAVASVLKQTYTHLEVVVVDDGGRKPLALESDDPRVRVIRNERSRGAAFSRNHGADQARGAYIAFLDDDDYFFPDKIEKQLAFLKTHPDVDLVFSKVCFIDRWGHETWPLHDLYEHDTIENFRFFNLIHTNGTLMRRGVFDVIRFDERLEKFTDMQFHLDATLHVKVAYLPMAAAVWHFDAGSGQLSRAGARKNYRNFRLICELFEATIKKYKILRFRYYGRLAFQALRCFDVPGAFGALWKIWR